MEYDALQFLSRHRIGSFVYFLLFCDLDIKSCCDLHTSRL